MASAALRSLSGINLLLIYCLLLFPLSVEVVFGPCFGVLRVLSSFAIISMRKRKLVTLL